MTLPAHLAGKEARGIVQGEPIAQFEIGEFQNFVYLVLDWDSREAAIVDPQRDLSAPLEALRAHGFRLVRILLTHTHFDHTAGVPELGRTHPNVPLTLHESDLHRLDKPGRVEATEDNELIRVGSLEVRALHTPGHSAGENCYLLPGTSPPYLLTGDTVFIRDCGRTDLPTGDTAEMFRSLQRIKGLSPETVILPGHHYQPETASTLEREMRESPPFRCKSVEELNALP